MHLVVGQAGAPGAHLAPGQDVLPLFPGMFETISANHEYPTRQRDIITYPEPRTSSAEETIRYYLPTFVEKVPNQIKDKIHTHSFKGFTHYAKIYYTNSYSSECDIENCYICNL